MIKICFLPMLLLFFLQANSQDSTKLFYVGKFATNKNDSTLTSVYDTTFLSQCEGIVYKGATVKLLFFKCGMQVSELLVNTATFKQWNDSVMFDLNISNKQYDNSDSMIIIPMHQFECKGIRSIDLFGLKGEQKKAKNLKLRFISDPAQAVVYLIPKIAWERDRRLSAKVEAALNPYRIPSGITPMWSPVQEYVYVCLFKYRDQYKEVECSPTSRNPIDSVYVNFNLR